MSTTRKAPPVYIRKTDKMSRPSITGKRIDGLVAMADRIEPFVKSHSAESLFAYPPAERKRIRCGIKLIRQLAEWQAGRKA